jgi:hypothetical protein
MRYVIAMSVATVFALVSSLFVASPVASAIVRQFTFDSPDTVASLHAASFMVVNVLMLTLGFTLGWALGRRFQAEDD